jgi:hypothetical protein
VGCITRHKVKFATQSVTQHVSHVVDLMPISAPRVASGATSLQTVSALRAKECVNLALEAPIVSAPPANRVTRLSQAHAATLHVARVAGIL